MYVAMKIVLKKTGSYLFPHSNRCFFRQLLKRAWTTRKALQEMQLYVCSSLFLFSAMDTLLPSFVCFPVSVRVKSDTIYVILVYTALESSLQNSRQ